LAGPGIAVSPAEVEAQVYLSGQINAGSANQNDNRTGTGWGPGTGWGGTANGTYPNTFNVVSPANVDVQDRVSGRVDASSANGQGTGTGTGWGPGTGWGGTPNGIRPDRATASGGGTFTQSAYQGGWVRENVVIEQQWGLPKADLRRETMVMEGEWSRSGTAQRQSTYNRNWPVSRSLQYARPGNNGQHAMIW
jgi:hypothetical protein